MSGYDSLGRVVLHYVGDAAAAELSPSETSTMFVSIRFHESTKEPSPFVEHTNLLCRVLDEVAPALGYQTIDTDGSDIVGRGAQVGDGQAADGSRSTPSSNW
jgi:hypothetical protein